MTRRRLTRVGYNAAAVLVLLVTVFPIYWMVATGFKRGPDILSFEPRWLPIPGTLENYRSAVAKPHFLQDVRYAARWLLRSRGFTTVAAVTLAVFYRRKWL